MYLKSLVLFLFFSCSIYSQEFPSFTATDSLALSSAVYTKYSGKYDFIIASYHKLNSSNISKIKVFAFKNGKVKKIRVKHNLTKNKIRTCRKWIWFWNKKNYSELPDKIKALRLLTVENDKLNRKYGNDDITKPPFVHLFKKERYYFEFVKGKEFRQIYSYAPQEYTNIYSEYQELKDYLKALEIFDFYW